jgi:hypothetical protein
MVIFKNPPMDDRHIGKNIKFVGKTQGCLLLFLKGINVTIKKLYKLVGVAQSMVTKCNTEIKRTTYDIKDLDMFLCKL